MIPALIVDDEQLARRLLARLLAAHPDFQIVGEAGNGAEALEFLSSQRPDVVFLDIETPGINAFEMLSQLIDPPLIVFATAFDEYAVRAFDANAIDYLLKPVQPARLAKALDKVRATLQQPKDVYQASLRRAVSTFRKGPPAKLAARRGRRIVLLSPREVVYIAIVDQLVFLHTINDRYASVRTIAELDEMLSTAGFFRISRSAIVNLTYARELLPWSSGTFKLRLSTNAELDVSRERARMLKAVLGLHSD